MPATWVELRDFAKQILGVATPCPEIHARCSISRAYYAAFHAIEPLARLIPSSDPPDHGDDGLGHKQVCQRMRQFDLLKNPGLASVVMEGRSLAQSYRQSLHARRDADYDLEADIDEAAAQVQILRVQDLLAFAVRTKTAFDRLGIK